MAVFKLAVHHLNDLSNWSFARIITMITVFMFIINMC